MLNILQKRGPRLPAAGDQTQLRHICSSVHVKTQFMRAKRHVQIQLLAHPSQNDPKKVQQPFAELTLRQALLLLEQVAQAAEIVILMR